MNAAHIHLLLNHIPVLGTVFALGLLVVALWRKSEELKKIALGCFVLVALVAVPAFFTGEPVEKVVSGLPGVSKAIIEQHEEAATAAFIGLAILGFAALIILAVAVSLKRPIAQWLTLLVLAGSCLVSGLMVWTANLGGQVRHTEIRSASALVLPDKNKD